MIDTVPFPEYPRPMLHREGWYNLNGWWDCAFTADAELPPAEAMQTKILVPYSPECEASGVGRTSPMVCRLQKPSSMREQRK